MNSGCTTATDAKHASPNFIVYYPNVHGVFFPDGRHFAHVQFSSEDPNASSRICVRSFPDCRLLATREDTPRRGKPVQLVREDARIVPDSSGQTLAYVASDDVLRVWNWRSGDLWEVSGETKPVIAFAIMDCGRVIVVGGRMEWPDDPRNRRPAPMVMTVHERDNLHPVVRYELAPAQPFRAYVFGPLRFSPDGRRLLLLRLGELKMLETLTGDVLWQSAVAAPRTFAFPHAQTGQEMDIGESVSVRHAIFSPDQERIAVYPVPALEPDPEAPDRVAILNSESGAESFTSFPPKVPTWSISLLFNGRETLFLWVKSEIASEGDFLTVNSFKHTLRTSVVSMAGAANYTVARPRDNRHVRVLAIHPEGRQFVDTNLHVREVP